MWRLVLRGAVVAATNTEGWRQAAELGLALLLSALIGLEREVRQKSAGLRTHSVVGVGAALFVLVSKYGFNDVLSPGRVVLDPSRVAAQIVTGIGFLGAGLIFVRRNSVHGLTTAAGVWLTAAVGATAGAGLPVLAVLGTASYFFISVLLKQAATRLPRSSTATSTLQVGYRDGQGVLRRLLEAVSAGGFVVDEFSTEPLPREQGGRSSVEVTLQVHGRGSINDLAATLAEIDGVEQVAASDINESSE